MSVYDEIVGIICDQMDVKPDSITPETDLKQSLKADSLDIVSILMELESEFDIEINEQNQEMPDVITVNDIVKYVQANK